MKRMVIVLAGVVAAATASLGVTAQAATTHRSPTAGLTRYNDTFSVQQFGLSVSEEEFLKHQSNPRVSIEEAAAIRNFSPTVRLVMDRNGHVEQFP